jgi:hypothetical protein
MDDEKLTDEEKEYDINVELKTIEEWGNGKYM